MSVAVRILPGEGEQEAISPVTRHVIECYKGVRESQRDFSELHDAIMQLEKFIFSIGDDAGAERIFSGIMPEVMARLNEAYFFWENRLDSQFAQRLARGQVSLAEYFLHERFETLIKRELSLLTDLKLKRILVIGSGALPVSALLVHLQTGAPVDCLPRGPETIEISRQVIERAGYSGAVQVSGAQISEIDLKGYDLVLIELPLTQKKSILKSLRKRCRPDCLVLCRTTHGLRKLLHQSTPENDRRGFHIKTEQRAGHDQTISTWLLEPAGSAATGVQLEW